MDNKYIKDFFEEDSNGFNDIIQNDNNDFPMEIRLSSCFHILSSIINDPTVSSELKSQALAMWSTSMEENSKKMLPEHIEQNDKYLTRHILDVDGENNINILDLAPDHQTKYELLESAKRQIAIGDFDTVMAATRAYSLDYNNILKFDEIVSEKNVPDEGHIGENVVTDESFSKSTLSSNNSDIMNSMNSEDKHLLLVNYLCLNDLAQEGAMDLDSESLNEMSKISENIVDHIERLDAASDEKTNSPIAFDPNAKEKLEEEKLKQENLENKNNDFSDTPPEVNVNFKDEIRRDKTALMNEKSLIQLNKIPLVTSNIYAYDKDVYDEGVFKSNVGRGESIMKINNVTGTATIPPSSFQKSEAFDLAIMNLVLKGKENVYLTPPKRGGLSAQKMFLESAIKSAIEVGEFEPSKIQVPKAFRKFKDVYIAELTGAGGVSNKMAKKDLNDSYENSKEIDHDDTSLENVKQKDKIQEKPAQKSDDVSNEKQEVAPEKQEVVPEKQEFEDGNESNHADIEEHQKTMAAKRDGEETPKSSVSSVSYSEGAEFVEESEKKKKLERNKMLEELKLMEKKAVTDSAKLSKGIGGQSQGLSK